MGRLLRATLPSTLTVNLDLNEASPRILGDPTSVDQVVLNLATNAAQAMAEGGTLTIRLEPLYVQDSMARSNPDLHEGSYSVLTISDTGHGIEPSHIDRVFEPFFTTRPPGSGTGLGLAMVHGIIKDHAGAIRLKSAPGEGTEVRCFFPTIESDEVGGTAPADETPTGRGEHVLFVDDEPALARIGERRLDHLGYRVTVATGTAEALGLLVLNPAGFDLVITDYTMPGRNGIQLATEIHQLQPDLPIVLTTGNIEGFSEDQLREAGIHRIMMKPVTMAELAKVCAEVMGGARKT